MPGKINKVRKQVNMEDDKLVDSRLTDENNDDQNDFSLYTEKIVVNPMVKYKKQLDSIKKIAIAAVVLIVVAVGTVIFAKYMKSRDVAEVNARNPLVIEKDEYDMYSKSPAMDPEEPDVSTRYYWIRNLMYNVSRTMVRIGDNTVGIIIGEVDGDYIILTEYNEYWENDKYYIRYGEEVSIATTVLSTDKHTGITLLAVNTETMSGTGMAPDVIELGNSYDVRQNEIVMALGRIQDNSEGYAAGFITEISSDSGIDMSYEIIKTSVEMQADDYALLFDMSGKLIGVSHTVCDDNDEKSEHIIGVSGIKTLIEQMSTALPVAYLGIKSTNITKDIAEKFHFPEGIYVTEVELDSPAYKAGIQAGDIITGLNGEKLESVQKFSDKILAMKKDDTVKVDIKRTGKGGEYRDIEYSAKLSAR